MFSCMAIIKMWTKDTVGVMCLMFNINIYGSLYGSLPIISGCEAPAMQLLF